MKPQQKVEQKVEPKVEEPKLKSVVSQIEEVYLGDWVKDRETGTKEVLAKLKILGQAKNLRGKDITASNVSSLTGAFFRDIKIKRKGKWDKLELLVDKVKGEKLQKRV